MGGCHALAGMDKRDMGELFAIQPTGDLALTDFETRSWFCYRPRRDVLVPVPIENEVLLPPPCSYYRRGQTWATRRNVFEALALPRGLLMLPHARQEVEGGARLALFVIHAVRSCLPKMAHPLVLFTAMYRTDNRNLPRFEKPTSTFLH